MDRKKRGGEYARKIEATLKRERATEYDRRQAHQLVDRWFDEEHDIERATGSTNVYNFGLDPRIANELDRHCIRTVADVCNHSRATLLILAALSATRVDEIESKLLEIGFALKD